MSSIIDLSVPVVENRGEPDAIKIKCIEHKKGANRFGLHLIFFGKKSYIDIIKNLWNYITGKRRLTYRSFPNEEFISNEFIRITSHTGTHMDAPAHFGTECAGKKSKTIDQIPLEWCYGDGVVLDMKHKKPGTSISKEDVILELKKMNYKLSPGNIVLFNTGVDKYWGEKEYFTNAPGIAEDATIYLIKEGIKVMGIDSYGFDRPFNYMINDYFATQNNKFLWPSHVIGRKYEYVHIERLCNLHMLPVKYGFKIACFPIKVQGTGASWVRAVAIID